jgi:hypothetical protein
MNVLLREINLGTLCPIIVFSRPPLNRVLPEIRVTVGPLFP